MYVCVCIYIYINLYIYVHIYIYIYIYIYAFIIYMYATSLLHHEQVCLIIFNERYSFERHFFHNWPMIKHVYDLIKLLYYKPWTHNICHIYLWHTKCSNLAEVRWPLWHMIYVMCMELFQYIEKPACKVYTVFSLLGGWRSCFTNQKFAHSALSYQIFILSHQKSVQPNKKRKTSFLPVSIAPVPFLFEFHTLLKHRSC